MSESQEPLLPIRNGNAPSRGWWAACRAVTLQDLMAGILGVFLTVMGSVSYAGIMCQTEDLAPHFGAVVQQTLVANTVGTLILVVSSQFVTTGIVDPLGAQFFVQAAALMKVLPEHRAEHILLLVSVFSILHGVLTWLLGKFRAGVLLKFIPFSILAGMLGGFGLIIVWQAWILALGMPPTSLFQGDGFVQRLFALRTSLFVLGGAGFHAVRNSGPLGQPIVLAVATVAFALVRYVAPSDLLEAPGWYLDVGAGAQDPLLPYRMQLVALVEPKPELFTLSTVSLFAGFFTFLVIEWTVHLPALEKVVEKTPGTRIVDHDREIEIMGWLGLAGGLTGGPPAPHSISIPLALPKGASPVWPAITCIGLAAMCVTCGWSCVAVIPQFMFGALLVGSGAGLVVEWMWRSRRRVQKGEHRLLVFTCVTIWYDALLGLFIGLVLAFVYFAIEYAAVTGVSRMGTLRDYRSNVHRPHDADYLEKVGGEVAILWLQGYLFFGSIAGVVDEVRAITAQGATIIVLDLSFVPAVDACGIHGLVDLSEELEQDGQQLIFAGLVRRLKRDLVTAATEHGQVIEVEADLDAALERCEDKLLHAQAAPRVLSKWPVDKDGAWLRLLGKAVPGIVAHSGLRRLNDGDVLFNEDEPAQEMIVVLSGCVLVATWRVEQYPVRGPSQRHLNRDKGDCFVFEDRPETQTLRQGAVLGAVECGLTVAEKPAGYHNATAWASGPTVVLHLPFDGLVEHVTADFSSWLMGNVAEQAAMARSGAHVGCRGTALMDSESLDGSSDTSSTNDMSRRGLGVLNAIFNAKLSSKRKTRKSKRGTRRFSIFPTAATSLLAPSWMPTARDTDLYRRLAARDASGAAGAARRASAVPIGLLSRGDALDLRRSHSSYA